MVPAMKGASGTAINAQTGGGRRRETEDLPVVVHNEEAGGWYRATGEDVEDIFTNGDKVSRYETSETEE